MTIGVIQKLRDGLSWGQEGQRIINYGLALIRDASTAVAGLVRLATNAETTTGTATDIATTPAGVKAAIETVAHTFTEAQTISISSGSVALSLKSSDAGAGEGPSFQMLRESASPAVSDILARLRFEGRDSGAVTQEYGSIYVLIVDPTAGGEDGRMILRTAVAGAIANQLTLDQGVTVGAATSGGQGTGTINATDFYKNGVSITTKAYVEANKNGTNQTNIANVDTKVTFTTEVADTGGNYNSGTSTFTAPRTGQYFVNTTFEHDPAGAANTVIWAVLYVNGSPVRFDATRAESTSPGQSSRIATVLNLTANDTVEVYAGDSGGGAGTGVLVGTVANTYLVIREL